MRRKGLQDRGLLFDACSPNGYRREAAVARIGGDRSLLPLLAVRAAGWVPQVRERSRRECLKVLFQDPMVALDLFPLAALLRRRLDGGWLAAQLEARIAAPELLPLALASEDRVVRRAAYASGRASHEQLKKALRDPDLGIRLLAANALVGSTDPEVRDLLRTSGTGALRALGIQGDRDAAVAALADPSSIVRANAQWVLRRNGEDAAPHYRKRLPELGAVAGLGETGTASDVPLLLPVLADERPKVRAEAARALARLGELRALVPLLEDPAPRVVRRVRRALRTDPYLVDEGTLLRLLERDRSPVQRGAAHALLCARNDWTRLVVDLRLLTAPDEPLADDAREDLDNWFRHESARLYRGPREDQARELRQLLTRAESRIGPHRARELRARL
ncbi:hypothetical protein GCM10017566_37670 [Amycolatopsis bartoniae]|uniref:HEAT repeat domain-containing protein n=1 Tax=Amycolatopsis bartoniae TaxID=941986 RepID=A0A8H9J0V3_9PSEU|nr:hypothetical protein GCM10017566_37670 [Amycolatopsis bartoniae]